MVQESQQGLGHAIYQAREHIGQDGSFILSLGDQLYKSNDRNMSCLRQLVEEFSGGNLVGVVERTGADVHRYGTIGGAWDRSNPRKINVTEIVEKPTQEYAKQHLAVHNVPEGRYLCLLGAYILNSKRTIEILEHSIRQEDRQAGLFGLTPVLEQLRREQGLFGYKINGDMYDIGGSPQQFYKAVQDFSEG